MTRKLSFLLAGGVLVVAAAGLMTAQERYNPQAKAPPDAAKNAPKESARPADEAAIRESVATFIKLFNKGDAKGLAELWTADGETIDDTGEVTHGREAITKDYAEFFAKNRGAKIEVKSESIRFVGRDVAVEEGVLKVKTAPAKPAATSRYSSLYVREGGKWLIAVAREEEDDASAGLQQIKWLIGTWEAKAKGGELRLTYEWAEDQNFIKGTYTHKEDGKVVSSGTQMIGWDANTATIRSWNFTADGGFGESVWSRDNETWVLDSSGSLAGGGTTTATNLLTHIDDDTYTWQSVSRTVDGETRPDGAPVKTTRVKPTN
jgi:uncharacterized protein (TIGR02246 family)